MYMATEKLDQLTDEEVINLIWYTTSGEMCSDKQKNILVRGNVYSVKSIYPKKPLDLMLSFGVSKVRIIKFDDHEVKSYNGKRGYLIDLAYSSAKKKFLTKTQEETKGL